MRLKTTMERGIGFLFPPMPPSLESFNVGLFWKLSMGPLLESFNMEPFRKLSMGPSLESFTRKIEQLVQANCADSRFFIYEILTHRAQKTYQTKGPDETHESHQTNVWFNLVPAILSSIIDSKRLVPKIITCCLST